MSTLLCDGFNPSGPNAHVSDAWMVVARRTEAEAPRLGDLAIGVLDISMVETPSR